ncbi:MAG: hypothetical protein ACE5KF_08125 [Kiloniellaceae bacterium]
MLAAAPPPALRRPALGRVALTPRFFSAAAFGLTVPRDEVRGSAGLRAVVFSAVALWVEVSFAARFAGVRFVFGEVVVLLGTVFVSR